MTFKEVPPSTILPGKEITRELTQDEINQYFLKTWTDLDKDYTKSYKAGKLISGNLAGKSTNAERTVRAVLTMYFDAVKEKINQIEAENEKNRCMHQVHELRYLHILRCDDVPEDEEVVLVWAPFVEVGYGGAGQRVPYGGWRKICQSPPRQVSGPRGCRPRYTLSLIHI